MGDSKSKKAKKEKIIKKKFSPEGNVVKSVVDPDAYYGEHPSWNFNSCDREEWSIYSSEVRTLFWGEIFPRLQEWEKKTWADILVKEKKQNHSLKLSDLNTCAKTRLTELKIEADAVISLRLNSTHRVYGTMVQSVFSVLWVDLDHGDNATCVCRSRKKHT